MLMTAQHLTDGGLSIRHTAVQVIFAGVDLPPAGRSALRCVPECCAPADATLS
jgi:hypothetical protein